ncbi:MAG: EamA family transporter [Anaerolineae bacterium]|nr:EamA family transporter [Anaerolineae bacterium]NIN99272.1 EamA family transporter [Anaerolineae bacterium]NIQ82111.1 EamA family transporter [Anaerolineae bacterium]
MKIRLTRTDLLVLCEVVIWAAGASVMKYGLREIGPLAFATVRFLASAVLMVIWVPSSFWVAWPWSASRP